MKKTIIKLIAVVVVIAVTVTVGVKIVQKVVDSPRGTIEKFESAYNSLDIDGMVECFDPSIQALYSGANSLLGGLIGFDISDFAAIAPFIAQFGDVDLSEMPKISIDINSIEKTSETRALVYCNVKFSGYLDEEETVFEMIKIDGEWYISGDDIINELF